MRIIQGMCLAGCVAILIAVSLPILAAPPQAASSNDVPVVNSGLGPCTADFVVSGPSGKGIYNAKIDIQIRYGFGGLHRLESMVGTNSDGKARMEGLPDQIKRSTDFVISYGDQTKSLPYDPQTDCHPRHEVVLSAK